MQPVYYIVAYLLLRVRCLETIFLCERASEVRDIPQEGCNLRAEEDLASLDESVRPGSRISVNGNVFSIQDRYCQAFFKFCPLGFPIYRSRERVQLCDKLSLRAVPGDGCVRRLTPGRAQKL